MATDRTNHDINPVDKTLAGDERTFRVQSAEPSMKVSLRAGDGTFRTIRTVGSAATADQPKDFFIIKGETPQKLAIYTSNEHRYWKEVEDGIDAWGDKGEHSILQNRAFVHFNLCPGLQLRLQHEFHLRHGNYRYYPSITGKNHEFYMGINYAL